MKFFIIVIQRSSFGWAPNMHMFSVNSSKGVLKVPTLCKSLWLFPSIPLASQGNGVLHLHKLLQLHHRPSEE